MPQVWNLRSLVGSQHQIFPMKVKMWVVLILFDLDNALLRIDHYTLIFAIREETTLGLKDIISYSFASIKLNITKCLVRENYSFTMVKTWEVVHNNKT